MTDVQNEPSESAIDVVKSSGKGSSITIFSMNFDRIFALLDASSGVIKKSREMLDSLNIKFNEAIPTQVDEKDEDDKEKVKKLDNGLIAVKFDGKEFEILKRIIFQQSELMKNINFYLHNILFVSAWGAFEGYIQAASATVFSANPHILSSDKQISIKEVIGAQGK